MSRDGWRRRWTSAMAVLMVAAPLAVVANLAVAPGASAAGTGDDVYVASANAVDTVPSDGGQAGSIAVPGAAGVAMDAAGDLYVATPNAVYELYPTSAAGQTKRTVLNAGLTHATGVAVDAAGDVFIADFGGNQVLEVPANGDPPVTVGTGFSGPNGVAVDPAGDVFVADEFNDRIVEVPADGGAQTTVVSGLNRPLAVAVDAAGNLYTTQLNGQLVEVPANGEPQVALGDFFPAVSNYAGLAVDSAGNVFVTDGLVPPAIDELPAGGGSPIVVYTGLAGSGLAVAPERPLEFTNPVSATLQAGTFGTVEVSASPRLLTPALSETGALPPGISFTDNGDGTATLSGTPTCGAAGPYPITLLAENGLDPSGSETLNLSVALPATAASPAFTSPVAAAATTGQPFNFTVTTNCDPIPAITAGKIDGLTLTDNHDGTATLAGTPTAGGVFHGTLTARDADGSVQQAFTLTVDAAPALRAPASVTVTTGVPFSVTLRATGYPVPVLSTPSSLPAGVQLVDQGNGTAVLSGTVAVGSSGAAPFTLVAANGVGAPAAETVTLKADEAPSVAGAASLSVQRNVTMTPSPLTLTGYPAPAVVATGLPAGLRVETVGASKVIGGKPLLADALGSYTVTLTARSAAGTGTQTLTVTLTP